MTIKFTTKRLYKLGGSYAFLIPSDFVKHGQIKKGNIYEVTIKEVK